MYNLILVTAAVISFGLTARATPLFQNTGTSSGWDSINQEHSGTVAEVTNVFYEGPTALKMTQIYDPSYTGRYHSEVVKNNVYKLGDQGFYGFMFRLQENWQFSPAQSYNIGQFIADETWSGCDDYMPSSMVWILGNQLYSRVKQGSACAQRIETFPNLATVTAGEWHKIEIQASWQDDSTGFYKLWYDGVKVLEKYDIVTTISDGPPFQFRVGLYANGWHDDAGGMKGTQGTRQVWYDDIAAGSTFADADADQW
ncbi:hypothetical protein MMC09_004945 [Bachmanniomyces sp. S44760]|nr:hypothetical protein [Bachmanniomyces sp. S44760]